MMSRAALKSQFARARPSCAAKPSAVKLLQLQQRRWTTTLKHHPHIYVFEDERSPSDKLLTLLPTFPPRIDLAVGSASSLPPTSDTFRENKRFASVLHAVLKEHAHADPGVAGQAKAFASEAGSSLGSGGAFFPQQAQQRKRQQTKQSKPSSAGGGGTRGDGAGGASSQGGAGGGGKGGWIHVSDQRNPPDFGRIAEPEDIFGSLEVDSNGDFVDGKGNYQESGTYRVVTRNGILGLSPFLRGKLIEQLEKEEIEAR